MNLLFVDDEPQILRAMERMLSVTDMDWNCEFVQSGAAALDRLKAREFDAIVSDMQMPGMNGAELLEEVSRLYPHIVRIVLSGQADRKSVFRAVNPMHQYLSKPCSADRLKQTLSRACALRGVLRSDSLNQLIGQVTTLPSMPEIYTELMTAIDSDEANACEIGQIISQDLGMTAKILKLANSTIFGFKCAVSSPSQATTLLGMETTKALVLTAGIFQKFDGFSADGFSVNALFEHSLEVARFSSDIAKAEKLSTDAVQQIFTAGVLHDIGKLVLATSAPKLYQGAIQAAQDKNIPLWQAERDVFGACHASIGAHLLSLWGLPQSIIEVVAFHHTPGDAVGGGFDPVTAVCVGNLISHQKSDPQYKSGHEICQEYLADIGCGDKFKSWQSTCFGKQN